MPKFIIEGGQPLRGEVKISGAKNAATPILAACLLTEQECLIKNVPRIVDVERMLKILRSLGAEAEWRGEHEVRIQCQAVSLDKIDQKEVCSLRSSVLFLGPLLARLGEAKIAEPGGCLIGNRPLDTHLNGFKALGAEIKEGDGQYHLKTKGLKGAVIILPEFSVTATENLIIAASRAQGKTTIKLAAAEPHVQDLCRFLNKMGVKISGIGTHALTIEGQEKISGAEYAIIPDSTEVGTFALAAAVTNGEVKVGPIVLEHLDIILYKLKEAGVISETEKDFLIVKAPPALKPIKIQAMPYPGFPTDLQSPFSVLATQAHGESLILDPMFEGRFGYIKELIKMGAKAEVLDPHRVIIEGPTPLQGMEIKSLDLRAGAALILAALAAQGESIIHNAEIVDRGYEKIEERLANLSAKIRRIE